MPDFISSLALVGLAQISLLLKLWLDHRQISSGLKLTLYSKQVEVFHETTAALNKVQQNSDSIKILMDEKTLPAEKSHDFFKDPVKAYAKDFTNLAGHSLTNEFLYTARMVVDIKKYNSYAWIMLLRGFDLQSSDERKESDISTDDLWHKQLTLYNSIINQMRLRCGIDALSTEGLHELRPRTRETTLLLRNINP